MDQQLTISSVFGIMGSLAAVISLILFTIVEWDRIAVQIGRLNKTITLVLRIIVPPLVGALAGAAWGAYIGVRNYPIYGLWSGAYIGAIILGLSSLLAALSWQFSKTISVAIIVGSAIGGTLEAQLITERLIYLHIVVRSFSDGIEVFLDLTGQIAIGSLKGAVLGVACAVIWIIVSKVLRRGRDPLAN